MFKKYGDTKYGGTLVNLDAVTHVTTDLVHLGMGLGGGAGVHFIGGGSVMIDPRHLEQLENDLEVRKENDHPS